LDSYSHYTKPWLGDCIGSNVVFDMATFMGEALMRLIPLTQARLYIEARQVGPAGAFARIVSLDDVPIAGGLVVGGKPEQRFE
jgi:hypothetical protein